MIYVIFGPTGSGKTRAALTLAKNLSAPIINADAFQIYKDMDIGTAKIAKSHPLYKDHYLLDIVEPTQSYSVKQYQTDFRNCLDDLLKTNKDVIICGGTGLYIRAGLYDYQFEEHEDEDVSDLDKYSNEELWKMLKELDEESTNNLHPNNRKRVIRAISIARNNEFTKSEMIEKQEHKVIYDNVRFLFLNPSREKLYENINERVDEMINNGLVDEVKHLLDKYQLSMTAVQAIGYKEIISYLNNEISYEESVELIKKRTRNYAKRQVTFFKHQFVSEQYETVVDLLKGVLGNE